MVAAAAVVPSHRCHSRSDAAPSEADAIRHPAIAATRANPAAARTLTIAAVCHRPSLVSIAANSKAAATITSAMGKCTSSGCKRPISAISLLQTGVGPNLFPKHGSTGPGIESGRPKSVQRVMPPRVFEEIVLPHLNAAFNYARWLTGNDEDAEDVVQDACLRAMRYFASLRDDDARAWLFAIVRNTWYSRLSQRSRSGDTAPRDDSHDEPPDNQLDPEALLLQRHAVARVRTALEQLPVDFREVIVLREIEGLSYKEIAAIVRVPIGTVMSRLARARDRLATMLTASVPLMERVR